MFNIDKVIKTSRNSSFNRVNYKVNISLNHFVNSICLYSDYDNKDDDVPLDYFMERITPEFQRSNDKWTNEMQLKFIENLLSGCETTLMLFRMSELEDAQLLDGLQRMTAIMKFFKGNILPFGYSYKDYGKI